MPAPVQIQLFDGLLVCVLSIVIAGTRIKRTLGIVVAILMPVIVVATPLLDPNATGTETDRWP